MKSAISNTISVIGAGATVTARLRGQGSQPAFTTDDDSEIAVVLITTANGSGAWSLDLERNDDIVPYATYWQIEEKTVATPGSPSQTQVSKIKVGSSDSILLDVMFVPPAGTGRTIFSNSLTQAAADARYGLYLQEGVGAVNRPILEKLRQLSLAVEEFGCVGDNSTDNTVNFQKALVAAKSGIYPPYRVMLEGGGIYRVSNKQIFSGANQAIRLEGVPSPRQNGSQPPRATIRYMGAIAGPVFEVTDTFPELVNFAIDNIGAAESAIDFTVGGRNLVERMSFLKNTPFSDAVLRFPNGLDYVRIKTCEFDTAAPVCILLNGQSTWLDIDEGCVFDTTGSDMTIVKMASSGASIEQLLIKGTNTCNSQTNHQIMILDASLLTTGNIQTLALMFQELDSASTTPGHRFGKFVNVESALFFMGHYNGGGHMNALIELTNSHACWFGPKLRALDGYFFKKMDSLSTVSIPFLGKVDVTNASGIIDPADDLGIVTYTTTGGAAVNLDGSRGNAGGTTEYRVDVLDGSAFNINVLYPAGGLGFFTKDQRITLRVRNLSGGVMGAISLNTGFKAANLSPTKPAVAKNRCQDFIFDGLNLVQTTDWSSADIPN